MTILITCGKLIFKLDYDRACTIAPADKLPDDDAAEGATGEAATALASLTDPLTSLDSTQPKWVRYGLEKRKHLTYIFNTFVFLQIFNEINCRKVGKRDFNVFEKILTHNWYFNIVVIGTFAAQILMCEFVPGITRTVPLSRGEWGACIAVGATPLLISMMLKLTPTSWLNRFFAWNPINEDTKQKKSGLLSAYHQAS